MTRKNIINISIMFVVSGLLIVGLAKWVEFRNPPTEALLSEQSDLTDLTAPLSPEALQSDNQSINNMSNPKAIFKTNKGTFELELFEDQMPGTVGNFITLAEDGFYAGTKFHRVIEGFMIQGGDPNSKSENPVTYGQGGPGYTIQDEFVAGENLSNKRGYIAMANTGQPNSGGSQFFINTVDNLGLDYDKDPAASKHPVFGHVVKGMETIDAISSTEVDDRDLPVVPIMIESITIVRN